MSSITKDGRTGNARAGATAALRTRVELWIVLVFMVLAFGAGLTIGVLAQPEQGTAVGVGTGTTQAPDNFGGLAPPLTDEQLQQGMPSGHPSVGDSGTTGSTGTDTGGKGGDGSQGSGTGNP
jgi:hypothetical protein